MSQKIVFWDSGPTIYLRSQVFGIIFYKRKPAKSVRDEP